jgi:hypothetical protein
MSTFTVPSSFSQYERNGRTTATWGFTSSSIKTLCSQVNLFYHSSLSSGSQQVVPPTFPLRQKRRIRVKTAWNVVDTIQ